MDSPSLHHAARCPAPDAPPGSHPGGLLLHAAEHLAVDILQVLHELHTAPGKTPVASVEERVNARKTGMFGKKSDVDMDRRKDGVR